MGYKDWAAQYLGTPGSIQDSSRPGHSEPQLWKELNSNERTLRFRVDGDNPDDVRSRLRSLLPSDAVVLFYEEPHQNLRDGHWCGAAYIRVAPAWADS